MEIDFYAPLPKTNDEGQLCARPTGEAARILRSLRVRARKKVIAEPDAKFPIQELSDADMAVLNAFAAQVAGKTDCKVRSIDGCHSCFMGTSTAGHHTRCDRWGNLVHTDCGLQCWLCAVECENGNGN